MDDSPENIQNLPPLDPNAKDIEFIDDNIINNEESTTTSDILNNTDQNRKISESSTTSSSGVSELSANSSQTMSLLTDSSSTSGCSTKSARNSMDLSSDLGSVVLRKKSEMPRNALLSVLQAHFEPGRSSGKDDRHSEKS